MQTIQLHDFILIWHSVYLLNFVGNHCKDPHTWFLLLGSFELIYGMQVFHFLH